MSESPIVLEKSDRKLQKKLKIVKSKELLSIPCEKVSVEEGEQIAIKLIEVLGKNENGLGLSANQIGIRKSVSIVFVKDEPIVLINPEIIEKSNDMVVYLEGCLSLPGKVVKTRRHKWVTVKADNFANTLKFEPDSETFTDKSFWEDKGLLQAVCVQHEIDHLNGKLITDSDVRYNDVVTKQITYGRNDKVMIEKGNKTEYVKYKKVDDYLKDGWRII